LLGPALAPPTGGFVAYYYSWRAMQLVLFASALLAFLCMYLYLPETSQTIARDADKIDKQTDIPVGQASRRFVILNPLKDLELLRSPNLLAVVCLLLFLSIRVVRA
jgi:predicted MFS family arabinose efflux permease